jgi:Tol biopolymer transport system component
MGGPDGENYEVNWFGVIGKSQYNLPVEGVTFTFPDRLTLPTREILALQDIPVCYECHRMKSPLVDADRQTAEPLDYPDHGETPAEAAVLTRLTTDAGYDGGAKWSPDGTTIAFVSNRSGTDQIWLMDADGKNQRQLTFGPAKHAWPDWSSDSLKLVCWSFGDGKHAIKTFAADLSGGTTVVESDEYLNGPIWQPGADYVAYSGVSGSNWDVWVAAVDGSEHWQLTTGPAMESNPRWSPDGATLSYKVAAGGQYSLTFENFITFENGFAQPTIHPWSGPESIQMNDWSPDGTQIAYTAEIISGASGADRVSYANMISTVRLEGGKAMASDSVVISKGRTLGDRGAVFSPDGTKVAFWAWDKNYRATLWLYDQVTDAVKALTTSGYDMYPQWSPDGKALVFESSRSGNSDLWLISLE